MFAELLALVVDDHFADAHFGGDLGDGLAGEEAAADFLRRGRRDGVAVLSQEVGESADAVVFVDLLGVPEDGAVADLQLAGDLFEGLAGEEEALDLRAAGAGIARGTGGVGELSICDF